MYSRTAEPLVCMPCLRNCSDRGPGPFRRSASLTINPGFANRATDLPIQSRWRASLPATAPGWGSCWGRRLRVQSGRDPSGATERSVHVREDEARAAVEDADVEFAVEGADGVAFRGADRN